MFHSCFLFFKIFSDYSLFIHFCSIYPRQNTIQNVYYSFICTFYSLFMHKFGVILALFSSFYGISPTFYYTFGGIFCHFLIFGIFKGVRGRTHVRFYFPAPGRKSLFSRFGIRSGQQFQCVFRSVSTMFVGNAQNTMFPGIGGITIYTGECFKIKAFRDFTL